MNQKHKKAILIALLLLFFASIKLIMLNWWQKQQGNPAIVSDTACRITQNSCEFEHGQSLALLGVADNQTPFIAEARGIPDHVQKITLSFSMRDMDMGFNRFELQKQGQGVWRLAQIHLPLCTANRHDWTVEWRVDEQKYTADFQTTSQK
ncbi:MAG: hypothetical protein Q4B82_07235 [Alysiella sp.]|uniref:hypothetical protein n=1 Tax=Alysiella sp. TaxID=1872483 RepID=UPI0026DAF8DF|nr:hypothetical protein [Alysiella sp.]MDO4434354.1 hypothetical protein [Alysiella sp.]